jgi:hypothetical protein
MEYNDFGLRSKILIQNRQSKIQNNERVLPAAELLKLQQRQDTKDEWND